MARDREGNAYISDGYINSRVAAGELTRVDAPVDRADAAASCATQHHARTGQLAELVQRPGEIHPVGNVPLRRKTLDRCGTIPHSQLEVTVSHQPAI